ncbi:MAG: hypothetical protein CL875_03375 [Dehalococcoidales bacterium]|nr:hypothetical protein [Dehalococcoidales bacterium]
MTKPYPALPGSIIQVWNPILPTTISVRTNSSDTYSAWSAVGAFVTESPIELLVSPAPQVPPTAAPSALPQLIIPDWMLYIFGGLLLTIVLLIITLLIVVIRLSRP